MNFSQLTIATLNNEEITQLLYQNVDDGQVGDLIFVVGSGKALTCRLPKVVALYHAKRAPKILISGGVQWPHQAQIEALMMRDYAVAKGVDPADIYLETRSLTTLENVQYSCQLLAQEPALQDVQRILVVTNTFHLNRLRRILETYLPPQIALTFCGAQDTNTRADNWFTQTAGQKRVHHELASLQAAIRAGLVKDYTI